MNVLKFELRLRWKMLLVWSVSMIAFLCFFVSGVYPIFHDGVDLVSAMIAQMPPEFLKAFNFDPTSLLTFTGFYEFGFTYFSVMGAIMALAITVSIFGNEKKNQCQEFLFVKPISRANLFGIKLLSTLGLLAVFNIIYFAVALFYFAQYDTVNAVSVMTCGALFLTQLVFMGFGVAIAVFKKKLRSITEIATSVGLLCFVLSALVNLLEKDALKYLSPLQFFTPLSIAEHQGYSWSMTLWACLLITLCIGSAYRKFTTCDAMSI